MTRRKQDEESQPDSEAACTTSSAGRIESHAYFFSQSRQASGPTGAFKMHITAVRLHRVQALSYAIVSQDVQLHFAVS
jgi:hypothetical protein